MEHPTVGALDQVYSIDWHMWVKGEDTCEYARAVCIAYCAFSDGE